jgi:chromosome segregation ATPase
MIERFRKIVLCTYAQARIPRLPLNRTERALKDRGLINLDGLTDKGKEHAAKLFGKNAVKIGDLRMELYRLRSIRNRTSLEIKALKQDIEACRRQIIQLKEKVDENHDNLVGTDTDIAELERTIEALEKESSFLEDE